MKPLPPRTMSQLRQRQQQGELRVRTSLEYRQLVASVGLQEAYGQTDVVAAADALITDQGALVFSLGLVDPPIRLRELQLGGISALVANANGDLVLPLGGGLGDPGRRSGAQLLADLLAGGTAALNGVGDPTALQPRQELSGGVSLQQLGGGRLLLHRAIVENGIVAVSSGEGLLRTAHGTVLGPLVSGLCTGGGPGSIGLTMPALAQLGPGSPVLVGGAIGMVVGAGSGHNPVVPRGPAGHALGPGASAAVLVDLEALPPGGVRSCFLEGHGAALLVPIAAPVALLDGAIGAQAAAPAEELQVPVLDLAIPRRVKPRLSSVSYAEVLSGQVTVQGRPLRCAPAGSPRLAAAAAELLVARLRSGELPLQSPVQPLSGRPSLLPLDL